jgi:hypothetical protein
MLMMVMANALHLSEGKGGCRGAGAKRRRPTNIDNINSHAFVTLGSLPSRAYYLVHNNKSIF